MTLVDTSLWIAVFSGSQAFDLEAEVDLDEVVTIGPVIQEVLQGFRHDRAFRHAEASMLALPRLDDPIPVSRFTEAARLYRLARRRGITPRSAIDCLIAAAAIHAGATVLHRDRDFSRLAEVAALRQRDVPIRQP